MKNPTENHPEIPHAPSEREKLCERIATWLRSEGVRVEGPSLVRSGSRVYREILAEGIAIRVYAYTPATNGQAERIWAWIDGQVVYSRRDLHSACLAKIPTLRGS